MSVNETNCDRMDGYLGRWLSEDECIQFEAHLANCPDCRQLIEESQSLNNLLARANIAGFPVPPALVGRIHQRLRRARRRRAAAWAAGLAAAALLIGAISSPYVRRSAQRNAVTQFARPQQSVPEPGPLVKVIFEQSSDIIAVPHKTDNPSVTIIWVYPTIKMDQESTPEPSDGFEHLERNGT